MLCELTFQGVKELREVVSGRGREDEGELSTNISHNLRPWNLPQHQITHLYIAYIHKTRNEKHRYGKLMIQDRDDGAL